jgi:hypothetical protein
VDGAGNVTVGGQFSTGSLNLGGGTTLAGPANENGYVVGFDGAGHHRWSRTLGGPTGTNDCVSVAVDSAGNIVTGGLFYGTADFGLGSVTGHGDVDAFVASYTAAGTPRFARHFGGAGSDLASTVATDAAGNVFVGGRFAGTVDFGTGPVAGAPSDGFLLALDSTGATKFARHLAEGGGEVDGVAADPSGNVVVTGKLQGAADVGTGPLPPFAADDPDLFVARFGGDGVPQFARRFGGSAGAAAGQSVTVTAANAIVIAGRIWGTVDLGLGPLATGSMSQPEDVVLMLAPH